MFTHKLGFDLTTTASPAIGARFQPLWAGWLPGIQFDLVLPSLTIPRGKDPMFQMDLKVYSVGFTVGMTASGAPMSGGQCYLALLSEFPARLGRSSYKSYKKTGWPESQPVLLDSKLIQ